VAYKRNLDFVNQILPANCEAYLRNKGWQETGKFGEFAKIYGKANDEPHLSEVIVPMRTDFVDYKNRVFDLLLTLQDVENRSLDYIAGNIIRYSDICKYAKFLMSYVRSVIRYVFNR
jgi:hypothetical protein